MAGHSHLQEKYVPGENRSPRYAGPAASAEPPATSPCRTASRLSGQER
ncbi:hypothetical protein HMPREF1549_00846 [Actinomyces johnsonii F0510]|uniref:Uncharacterized protein n=1 Tax=Actinomyces johnsonii F0510 TaxID=1227262 RepID=U1QGT8_9ACTO|nr:hypothetical protein HMPREF1549_00846 [Actinomyces johnsonii F0510]